MDEDRERGAHDVTSEQTEARHVVCGIVPPYLLERIAGLEAPHLGRAATAARYSLLVTRPYRFPEPGRAAAPVQGSQDEPNVREVRDVRDAATNLDYPAPAATRASAGPPAPIPGPHREISDADRTETLPGRLIRTEGAPEDQDSSVNEAYDGLGATHRLFAEAYRRNSIDDRGLPLFATVHYGDDYDNAFWNGERMVFGDGDGEVFRGFTRSLSVIGHELSHGVTQFTAGLVYQGQSGALNEHVSDVFGALVEQYASRQSAADASWLIGVGLFTDQVEGEALRSMIHPGTAYDDDVLGKDPQPAHFDDYVETSDDEGGVHLNSGIPNRAFAVAATTLGGNAWERTGQVWYDTLTATGTGALSPTVDFAGFAAATLRAASLRYGVASDVHRAVATGWDTVGVTPTV
ncbi:M4 family metallopeptidase [Plantibacter sp. YIM 135347]|uniref:M4 family metallopeptidase n=1 Tax=Plantibacter sp. YIM 135347 TaxID=3423919 RepID=UPI003D331836